MSGQSGQLIVQNMYGGYEPYLNQEGAAKEQRQVGHVPQRLERHATEPEHSAEAAARGQEEGGKAKGLEERWKAVCAVMTYGERQL
jgi:hypothetical protein